MKKSTGLVIGLVVGTCLFPGVGTIIGGYIGWDQAKGKPGDDRIVIIHEEGNKNDNEQKN